MPPELRPMEASPVVMHGSLAADKGWAPPVCVCEVGIHARRAFTDIRADEWTDLPEVLKDKVDGRGTTAAAPSRFRDVPATGPGFARF